MGAEASQPLKESTLESLECERQREINRMDQMIRSRIRSGVQYNMKVILRGERGSGKTSLWKRFQGLQFQESYQPTPEIQSATINWTFRNNSDNVKVEVWDVVDKAIKSKLASRWSETNNHVTMGRNNIDFLDATIVDVYKDTQAVIFMINPTAPKSLDYVRSKAIEVPFNISILIILGFKDLIAGENAKCDQQSNIVTIKAVIQLCKELKELRSAQIADTNCAGVHCIEASLLNCYGLQKLYKYLDIPFLQLKTAALRAQLQTALGEMHDIVSDLESTLDSTNYHDYEEFEIKYLARKRTNDATSNAKDHAEIDNMDGKDDRQKLVEFSGSDTDDLKDSLSTLQRISTAQTPSIDSEKSPSNNAKGTSALKLEHYAQEFPKQHATVISSQKGNVERRSTQHELPSVPISSQLNNHIETEIERFRPADESSSAHLEGFLEPSDEDEKSFQKNKQQIRKYVRPEEAQYSAPTYQKSRLRSTKNMKSPPTVSDSDEDDSINHQHTMFTNPKTESGGKILRKAKLSNKFPEESAVRGLENLSVGEIKVGILSTVGSQAPLNGDDSDRDKNKATKSGLKKAAKTKRNVDRPIPVEMDF